MVVAIMFCGFKMVESFLGSTIFFVYRKSGQHSLTTKYGIAVSTKNGIENHKMVKLLKTTKYDIEPTTPQNMTFISKNNITLATT